MDVTYDRSVLYETKRQFCDLFAIRESFGSICLAMSNKFLFQVGEILKERYENVIENVRRTYGRVMRK